MISSSVDWHLIDVADAARSLGVDIVNGLSDGAIAEKHAKFGSNELKERRKKSLLSSIIDQFKNFLVLILVAAAVVSILLGELKDSIVILIIVIMNAVLGVVQEERASKAIEALKKMSAPKVMVKRSGEIKKISVKDLVPGDILFLETGGVVGADSRIIESINLKVSEAALTGESAPVEKTSDPLTQKDIPVADMKNMVFMGTTVAYGRGQAVVVSTGMQTQIGHIAEMVQDEIEVETPLEKKLAVFGKWLGLAALFVCFLVFLFAFIEGDGLFDSFLTAVSLAVAAIPEGLPAVTTISLALGAYRMSKRGAIIRKLPAVETLGSVSVICTDKTGTLTQNKMSVNTIYVSDSIIKVSGIGYEPKGEFSAYGKEIDPLRQNDLKELLNAVALCNDSFLEHFKETGQYDVIGDPTEGALTVLAEKAGLTREKLTETLPRVSEIPFDSRRKLMTTVHKLDADTHIIYVKGAPDELIKACLGADSAKVLGVNAEFASQGLRTLGVAYKIVKGPVDLDTAEKELQFLGLVGMIDLARPEVKEAVRMCKEAGITPVMITGDHKLTAMAIAKDLGIDEVYARVSPEDKLNIVESYKQKGHVVAVTGDGVNDAPALKRADIGISMGITGTDVAKEASDMVLADDNFATIVAAVEEGRGIFENIRKFVWYLLSANVGEICTMLFAIVLRWPLPLLPIQILWVNLVTDGLPALALSVEPIEKDVMKRKPRKRKEGIMDINIIVSMVLVGGIMGVVTLVLFAMGLKENIATARTMAFTALTILEMYHVFNCRSESRSIFTMNPFSNIYLLLSVIVTVGLQVFIIYNPFCQKVFDLAPLSMSQILWVFVLSSAPIWVIEIKKAFEKLRPV
jgi:P-type Ca2+ transporter type 2C